MTDVAWLGQGYGSAITNLTDGLVGWWKLDDGSGLTAVDSSGNGFNGTVGATAQWNIGFAPTSRTTGSIYIAPDTTGSIDCGLHVTIQPTNAGSFSFWLYRTNVFGGGGCVAGWGDHLNDIDGNVIPIFANASIGNEVSSHTAHQTVGTSKAFSSLASWDYFVLTWKWPTSIMNIYTNGVLADNASQTILPTNSVYHVIIGRAPQDATHGKYQGWISDFRIYNKQLTVGDQSYLYHQWYGK